MRDTSANPQRRRYSAPPDRVQRKGSPFLPIDTPPRPSVLPRSVLRGLIYDAVLDDTAPVPRPWAPYQSQTMPESLPSNVGPAMIGTRVGIAINTYSPAAHFRGGQIMEQNGAVPTVRAAFASTARGSRRLQGRAIPYPFALPKWLTPNGRLVS